MYRVYFHYNHSAYSLARDLDEALGDWLFFSNCAGKAQSKQPCIEDRAILLSPRGEPSPACQWSNPHPRPRPILVSREDANNWYGRPLANPACPELQYPKLAWKES